MQHPAYSSIKQSLGAVLHARLACSLLAFAAAWVAPGHAQTTVGTWSKAAPLPVIQSEWDGATIGDSLFMVGGERKRVPQEDATKASDELWIYDAKGDKWTQGANMPGGRNHPAVVSLDGMLYVFGGYDFACCNNYPWPYGTNNAWQYNPKTNAWKTLAPIPRKLGAGMAAAFESKIYVMAGTDSGQFHSIPDVHEYDPANNTWRARAPMTNAREHVKGAVVDSLIYVIGGHSKPGNTKVNQAALEAYSPRSDKWYAKGNMPTPRGGIGVANLGGKIFVFGGEGADFKLFSQVDQYDPATGQWTKVNDIPYSGGIHGQATMVHAGKAHLVGGSNPQGFNPRNYHDVFTVPAVVGVLRPMGGTNLRILASGDGLRLEGLLPGRYRASLHDPAGRLRQAWNFSGSASDLPLGALGAAGTRLLSIEGPDGDLRTIALPR